MSHAARPCAIDADVLDFPNNIKDNEERHTDNVKSNWTKFGREKGTPRTPCCVRRKFHESWFQNPGRATLADGVHGPSVCGCNQAVAGHIDAACSWEALGNSCPS